MSRGTAGSGNDNVTGGFGGNPPDGAPPTLAEAGIDKNLADRARKLAALSDGEFNGHVDDCPECSIIALQNGELVVHF